MKSTPFGTTFFSDVYLHNATIFFLYFNNTIFSNSFLCSSSL